MIAVDFGHGDKLRLHGDNGPMEVPKLEKLEEPSLNTSEYQLIRLLAHLLEVDDVVIESASPNSSGLRAQKLADMLVGREEHQLFVLSGRVVKSKIGLGASDIHAASILHNTAAREPHRMRLWKYQDPKDQLKRNKTSVRPNDKLDYQSYEADVWMRNLAPFQTLPGELRDLFWNGRKRKPDYNRALVLPFAMAFDELDARKSRTQYEKIIGLYEHGYPSFYRRATINLMQLIARRTRRANAEPGGQSRLSKEERKAAWRVARPMLRKLYTLSRNMSTPGNSHPATTGKEDPGVGNNLVATDG
jgi:hypothetical protein